MPSGTKLKDMTKEERREYNKAYYVANKDKEKAYREANKERIASQKKLRNEKNKEEIKAKIKAYVKSRELPYTIIYCIPNYNGKDNYVGITSNPYIRMINHKSLGKFNTSKYIELDRADTREEALKLEREYHDRGYHGKGTGRPRKQSK